ncbi:MAG TPA: CocE/NonD family hydrolase [archaeon]|nr:CocE/NonD family hydrolase [archaeon]
MIRSNIFSPSHKGIFILAMLFLLSCVTAPELRAADGQKTYRVRAEFDIKVQMRDGTLLSTDVYRPDTAGAFPVLLERTPYNNFDPRTGYFFAERGYAVVLQDVRGKHDSDGSFYPVANEAADGYDTQTWCGTRSWSNGRVGTMGGSYVGATQWFPATLANDHLVCMFPTVAASDLYGHWVYDGGAFALSCNTMWGVLSVSARVGQEMSAQPLDWDQLFRTLPLGDIPHLLGRSVPWFTDWLSHPTEDDYWKKLSVSRRYEQIKVPAFNLGGWYDIFIKGTVRNFAGVRERGGSEKARRGSRLVVGPWFHTSPSNTKMGQVEFGPQAALDERALQLRWFDYWLKDEQNGVDQEAPVKLFLMGVNRWQDFYAWPPEGVQAKEYYFHSRQGANSLYGDGALDTVKPVKKERVDTYRYDPADPVPTSGGNACCRELIVPQGPYDQRPVERRSDVLVYTSEPVEEPLAVVGPLEVKLWAASSAVNTDFTAKLVDVDPAGKAINISSGILRAPFKDGFERWNELIPGKPYELTITLRPTANVFLAGHRIRVEISSSDFPRFDRNLNTTGASSLDKTGMSVADQQVFHDPARPSHIILPVLKGP